MVWEMFFKLLYKFPLFKPSSPAMMVCAFMHMQAISLCPAPPQPLSLPHCSPVCVCMYISIIFAKMELKKVFCFVQAKEGGNQKDFKET